MHTPDGFSHIASLPVGSYYEAVQQLHIYRQEGAKTDLFDLQQKLWQSEHMDALEAQWLAKFGFHQLGNMFQDKSYRYAYLVPFATLVIILETATPDCATPIPQPCHLHGNGVLQSQQETMLLVSAIFQAAVDCRMRAHGAEQNGQSDLALQLRQQAQLLNNLGVSYPCGMPEQFFGLVLTKYEAELVRMALYTQVEVHSNTMEKECSKKEIKRMQQDQDDLYAIINQFPLSEPKLPTYLVTIEALQGTVANSTARKILFSTAQRAQTFIEDDLTSVVKANQLEPAMFPTVEAYDAWSHSNSGVAGGYIETIGEECSAQLKCPAGIFKWNLIRIPIHTDNSVSPAGCKL